MRRRLSMLFVAGLYLFGEAESALAQPPPQGRAGQEAALAGREAVERLVRVEQGQNALNQRVEDTNRRIDDLRIEVSKRLEDTNKRIDDLRIEMNARFAEVMTLLQIIISTLVALVLAIAGAGFIMWRKILAVDAAMQTRLGLDEVVREQVGRLERDVGFLQGKVRELEEALAKR